MKAVAAGLLAAIAAFAPASAQRFSVSVEAVRVDVLVTEVNRPVGGLTAGDFEVRDSGVVQRIDSVALEDVPLSVMLALDTSASVQGQPLVDLKRAVSAVMALLSNNDRAALLTFDTSLHLVSDWTANHAQLERASAGVAAAGATALHDAAYAALTMRDTNVGRSLVVVFTDGQDTASWLPGRTVLDVARRNDAVVYAVGLLPPAGTRLPGYRLDFRSGIQFPIPKASVDTLMEGFLQALTSETGGQFINAERSAQLRDTFVRIVNESRSRYLLTYSPRGVDAGGWHPIEVTVKGRKVKVTARKGYLR